MGKVRPEDTGSPGKGLIKLTYNCDRVGCSTLPVGLVSPKLLPTRELPVDVAQPFRAAYFSRANVLRYGVSG